MADPVRNALRVSWATIIWSAGTGVASIILGVSAASLALVGSGAAVLVDVTSSMVLVWRFRHPQGHHVAELRAQLVAAAALITLALLLSLSSVQRLLTGGEAHPTTATTVLAAASVVILPLLAWRKYTVAARVPSQALRTDAHITVVGASTAALALMGFLLTEAGAGWADPAAALIVAAVAGVIGLLELRSSGGSGPLPLAD